MPFSLFVTLTLTPSRARGKGRGPDLKRLSAPSGAEPALSRGEGHPLASLLGAGSQGDSNLR